MVYTVVEALRKIKSFGELETFCDVNGIEISLRTTPRESIEYRLSDGNHVRRGGFDRGTPSQFIIDSLKNQVARMLDNPKATLGMTCNPLVPDRRTRYKNWTNANLIHNVIFNDPATIVFWTDGTKTIVKAENEPFDPEKGLAMAISKKFLGNKGNYFNVFKKWLPEEEEVVDELAELENMYAISPEEAANSVVGSLKPEFKVGDRVRHKVFPYMTGTVKDSYVGFWELVPEEEIKKVCSNCKHVKPFSNPVCDKCTSADKFEAKEEKDE